MHYDYSYTITWSLMALKPLKQAPTKLPLNVYGMFRIFSSPSTRGRHSTRGP
jgi:hypothetical protein